MKLSAYIDASGENFSPKKIQLPNEFKYILQNEPNELGLKGRFKGLPRPYGHARVVILLPGVDTFFYLKDSSLIKTISEYINTIRKANADDIFIHIDIEYQTQCNLQIEPEWLISFSQLAVPITLSVYEKK